MSGLSTHVLDLVKGGPASGVSVKLMRDDALIWSGMTDSDGRCVDMTSGALIEPGSYRLVFGVGDYFASLSGGASTSFYDEVPVEFRIIAPGGKYHVPLLVSPFGYSTYRGS